MKNPIKKWMNNRHWKKKYGMDEPYWAEWDVLDPRFATDPSYQEWLANLSDEHKKEIGSKMRIVTSELDRLSDAIEDEIIKRGGKPDLESQSYPNESTK